MTLKHVRPFARLVADWCLEQDDLAGFEIQILEDPGRVLIVLDWPNGWRNWRAFSLRELELSRDLRFVTDILESFAADARQRAARIAEARANLVRLREQGRDAGTLDRELRFYRSHLDDLLGPGDVNEGKHVVIKGEDIAGVCDTFEEALRVGYDRYGLGPFLIRKIERVETIHRIW
jgi:hypothetical protein